MRYPKELVYTKDHEWARVDGDSAVIGITSFAVEQLGDITLVELPEKGKEIVQGRVFGTVESVKTVSDLYAPFSGRVVDVNAALEDSPELVNQAPYGDGWMIKVAMTTPDEVKNLMDAEAYTTFAESLEG